jgi:alkanesulfonate monooxygenase SsuD/methylene tetrahydromethanopterin reductase-like flavin-dependent oxidoreductase (luciferase family)
VDELTPRDTHPWVAEAGRKIGFGAMILSPRDLSPATVDFARRLERLGFSSLFIADHPLGNGDCWTTLAAFAVATRAIRLGTLVCCVYYRPPELLARHAADVDRLSGGRLTLGLGIGDAPDEFERMGLHYPSVPERQRALDDTIGIVRGLWGEQPLSYDGERATLRGANVRPGPVQGPRVPILIAGGGEKVTLRQVARYADVSNFGEHETVGTAQTLDDVRRKFGALRRYCDEIGRDYDAILRTHVTLPLVMARDRAAVEAKYLRVPERRRTGQASSLKALTPEEGVAYYRGLAEAGMQHFVVGLLPDDVETAELVAERVMPAFD